MVGTTGRIGVVARTDTRNRAHGGDGGDRHKGHRARAIRISDELWESVKNRADTDGYETLNEAMVSLLEWYVARPKSQKRL